MVQDTLKQQRSLSGDNLVNPEFPVNALLCRKIIDILDGDYSFKAFDDKAKQDLEALRMPYLKGPRICEIAEKFGLHIEYKWGGGALPRHEYMRMLLEHCLKNNQVSNLFAILFSKQQFVDFLNGASNEENDSKYSEIVKSAIYCINLILHFHNCRLVQNAGRFVIQPTNHSLLVSVPLIKQIDRGYISTLSSQAFEAIERGDNEGAISKSRTLLEEVLICLIEKKGDSPNAKGSIKKLLNQVRELYGMQQNEELDRRIHTLLSGLNAIVDGIAEMRNIGSDAHGLGTKRIKVPDYYARLCVNSALILSEFLLSVAKKNLDKAQNCQL